MSKKKFVIGEGILLSFTLLFITILTSQRASADSSGTVNVSITVPSTCSLSITDDDLIQTIYPGTDDTIGTSHLKALCNDGEGLAIYTVGYTGDTFGDNNLRMSGTNNLIPSSIASTDLSRWHMKVSHNTAVQGNLTATISDGTNGTEDFTDYHIVPTTYTKIASYPSTTDQTIGVNLDTEFYAYVSAEQPAGTYEGKVKFLLIHPNIIDSSTNPTTETPSVLPTMQTVSTWGSSVTAGQEVMAVDARDGKFYTVARLADGNLWMTQNLDLDIDSTRTYTSADTDLPANTTWTPSSSTYPTNNNAWAWSEATPESYDPGELYWSGNIDSTYTIQTFDATGDTHYHVGNYYNWTAAVAMNDTASYTVDQTAVDQSICPAGWTLPRPGYGDDTLYSLLSGYSVNTAAVNSGSSYYVSSDFNIGGAPTYFTYTGCVASSSGINGANNYGFYWTNVVNSSSSAYDMRSYGGYDNLFNYLSGDLGNGRAFGEPIRCIARPVSSTITFTPE